MRTSFSVFPLPSAQVGAEAFLLAIVEPAANVLKIEAAMSSGQGEVRKSLNDKRINRSLAHSQR